MTVRALLTPSLLATALLFACKSELDNKPAAKVEDAKPAAEPAAPPVASALTYKVDVAASKIGFVGAKLTGDHTGGFGEFTGEATINGGEPTAIKFEVAMASLTSDADGLTTHLKSPDFFDVETYPTSTFTSTAITKKSGEGDTTHEITGDLTLHGATKSITFPAVIKVESAAASGRAEFKIDRQQWGIVFPGKPDDLIKDEVLLKLDLRFTP